MAPPERSILGRRAVLVGGASGLAVLVGACRGTPAAAPPSTPGTALPRTDGSTSPTSPSTGPGSQAPAPAAETADRTRLRMALEKTEAMLAGLLSLRRRAEETRGLVELHTTHRLTLLELLEEAEAPLPAPGSPPLTRAEVPLREGLLQAELVSAALAAEAGPVARVLAAMSAGIAQRLALLPAAPPADPVASDQPSPSGADT